jgi:antitoxin component of MazEF toxin-antitoxin module
MNSTISKCDDKFVITLPANAVEQLDWGSGDLLTLTVEGGSLTITRTKTKHDHAMEILDKAMVDYRETFEALAKS